MRLLKAKQVAEKTSLSIPHLRRMAREGRFPKPLKITDCRSGWLEEDVDQWIAKCIRDHRA